VTNQLKNHAGCFFSDSLCQKNYCFLRAAGTGPGLPAPEITNGSTGDACILEAIPGQEAGIVLCRLLWFLLSLAWISGDARIGR